VTRPRFLVSADAFGSAHVVLTGAELHHLRVRHLRVGSEVTLADGQGNEHHGTVESVDRQRALVRLEGAGSPRESGLRLVLAQALLKGGKLDLVVEKTTELGVSDIILFTSERSISHVSDDRKTRWGRIARSAAKQSQRSQVPRVDGPIPFADAMSRRGKAVGIFLWEEAPPGNLRGLAASPAESVIVVVGPEGGFSAAEADLAVGAGFHCVGLGGRILRAETAAIVAVTVCQLLWGDLGDHR